jgi:hypothetical protein
LYASSFILWLSYEAISDFLWSYIRPGQVDNFEILTSFFVLGFFHISVLAVYRQRVAIHIKINENFIRKNLSIHEQLCTTLCVLPLAHLHSGASKCFFQYVITECSGSCLVKTVGTRFQMKGLSSKKQCFSKKFLLFWTRPHTHEKKLLAPSHMSVRPYVSPHK